MNLQGSSDCSIDLDLDKYWSLYIEGHQSSLFRLYSKCSIMSCQQPAHSLLLHPTSHISVLSSSPIFTAFNSNPSSPSLETSTKRLHMCSGCREPPGKRARLLYLNWRLLMNTNPHFLHFLSGNAFLIHYNEQL